METPLYRRVLVALDSSPYAGRALTQGVAVASLTEGAVITGLHAFAAKLHDLRFRQMEGGLPEQYRQEEVLEDQRQTHDTLISKGLTLISDSYLAVGQRVCQEAGIPYQPLSVEGKNYAVLSQAVASGGHDLLVMGAQGVGAVPGEQLGGVCARTVRRTSIDTLVVKQPGETAATGPIVVALDGSAHAYGGLCTALQLGRHWQRPVILVAAYDPHYHYVVFNNIAQVLSTEGAQVFKFEEQEKLHEEIIDSGLAKIYQAHLDAGASMAREQGIEVECVLLAGKPTVSIARFLHERTPSLLVLGKIGIHADAALDIGWVTENLLRLAPCDLLISCRTHLPELDRLARFTTSWSVEAEARMERVPVFVRQMARMAILRYAADRGHTVITERLVEEATAALMPAHAHQTMAAVVQAAERLPWSRAALAMLATLADEALQANVRLRAEKAARQAQAAEVMPAHVAPFLHPQ
ncbi:MAG: universal stress protein [Magnetococcus sp. DMHC-8]